MNTNIGRPSAIILIVASVIGRLIPHPANFTPLGATALFGGSHLSRPWNYLAPLFVLFVTDVFLGFHGTMLYVYASFLIIAFFGERLLKKKRNLLRVAGVSVSGALIFFLVSNFGVWMEGLLYPKTWAGLVQCYVAAVPFLRNMFLGDMIFSVGFFGLYAWAEKQQLTVAVDKRVMSWLGGSK
jgi:hypothetical protein